MRQLAERGSIALLHNRVWGDFNENAAYLSVGASERMAAPVQFTRWEELREFQPDVANRRSKIGALGKVLQEKGIAVGNRGGARARLVTSSAQNLPVPVRTNPELLVEVIPDRLVQSGKINRYFEYLLKEQIGNSRTIYIAAPFTPEIREGTPYRRLGFLIAVGAGIPPGSLLISGTTRTPGLVANVDIAPMIAHLYGTMIPGAAGQAVRSVPARDVWGTLTSIERQTNAAARATTPVLGGYGIFACLSCTIALVALQIGSDTMRLAARLGLLLAASVLPALLVVGILAPDTAILYGAILSAIAVVLAVIAQKVAARVSIEPLRLVFYVLVGTIVLDSFVHTHLVERSLLSATTLTGIRFYGIGNEWFGLLLGAALVAVIPGWLGLLVVCAVGLPYFGADAGGTLAAATGFVVLSLARKGPLKARHFLGAFVTAIGVTLLFAILDRLQPGSARSHVGAAVATGQSASGFRALSDIILRKIEMNAGLLLLPWTIAAIVGMAAVVWGLRRVAQKVQFENTEMYTVILPSATAGGIVAVLFNDGGVASGLLLLLPVLVWFLDVLLRGRVEQERSSRTD